MIPDLIKNPDSKLYVYCTLVSVVAVVAASVIGLAYIAIATPSEAYILTSKGDESLGIGIPVLCIAVFILCLALVIKDLIDRLRDCPPEDRDRRFMRAPLSKAGILMAITAFTSIAVVLFSDLINESITNDFIDEMTDYELIVSMACAGPQEEFLCRILMIGLPVFIISAIKGYGNSSKYLFGGFGMSKVALVFLIISSVVFGLIHLDGWSIMKFPDTFISGMLFGYVYIEYGAHTSIVMHSAFDILASFDVFFDGAGTVQLIALAIIGVILTIRSLCKIRDYFPEKNLHDPFEGTVLQMWGRD